MQVGIFCLAKSQAKETILLDLKALLLEAGQHVSRQKEFERTSAVHTLRVQRHCLLSLALQTVDKVPPFLMQLETGGGGREEEEIGGVKAPDVLDQLRS